MRPDTRALRPERARCLWAWAAAGRHKTPVLEPVRSLCAWAAAGRHKTPIVDALWRRRSELGAGAAASVPDAPTPGERVLMEKVPSDSAASQMYAFSSDEALADMYRNPWGRMRVGRFLEDLDAMAGTVAFSHCQTPGAPNLLLVTASVDRIVYRHRPNLERDIRLDGRVNWVGRSSMEIGMVASAEGATTPFLEAAFTFVARDPSTNRAARINPLVVAPDGSDEARRFALAQERDATRKRVRAASKANVHGHSLDSELLHTAHELLGAATPLLELPALADGSEILMSATALQDATLCMPQQRNPAGRIFGGFLMRRAFELGFSSAYLFAGRMPVFLELDEVTFREPVSVGDLVRFESAVLYTSEVMDVLGRLTIHVEVRANVIKPEARTSVTSNTFNFTFGVADESGRSARVGGGVELKRVVPATHEQAYRILERYKADLVQRSEDESQPPGGASAAPPASV